MEPVKELNLLDLPQEIEQAKGNMPKVLSIIYNNFSSEVHNNNNNNNNTYTIKAAPERVCIFIMPDGKKVKFKTELTQIVAVPKYEIVISLGQSPDSLYLDSIKKSSNLKGVDATNYSYEIAAALGAKWLHVWDAAAIRCNVGEDEEVRSYPLSIYRALTSQSKVSPSWYENVAIKHGFSTNSTKSEIYNYAESINKLRLIKIGELLTYYKTTKSLIESEEATKYAFIDNIKSSGSVSGIKTEFSDDEREKVVRQLSKIVTILEASEHENLVDFLKAPAKSCLDKAYILRSFPGESSADMEIPNILFNEDDEKISEFPYLVDSLIVAGTSTHPSIKLIGGAKKQNPSSRMTKADWVVVVPSYNRVEIFKEKTLALLKDYNIPKDKIYVFVANEEQKKMYDEGIGSDVGHVIVGVKGLVPVRNFIFDYFPKGQALVSFDDDVKGFLKMINPKKAVKLDSLKEMINRGFSECDKAGAKFWGVYPVANPFFMKQSVSTDFKFVIGSFWGCYNPGKEIQTPYGTGEKEDYQRTILFWERDKVIVRLNDVAIQTGTYKTPGGLQEGDRLEREKKTVDSMLKKWPEYIKPNPSRKSKFPELRLIRQTRKNKAK